MEQGTADGETGVGEVKISQLTMEGEREGEDVPPPEHQCPMLCDALHGSITDTDNSSMMRAVLCNSVCKVYRFRTESQCWMLVREQMSETPLTFSLPTMLLETLIQEDKARIKELNDLGDFPPQWAGLRRDIISHCSQLIGCYQETLTELGKHRDSSCFKSSLRKSDQHLQFVPTNLHVQTMEVITSPHSPGVCYDVITVGAPAEHHKAFKHGGLKRLLSKHTNQRNSSISYTPEESSRARALLANVAQLQPLVFGLVEEVLAASLELSPARLQHAVGSLTHKTEQFVHALKDELVKSASLALHYLCPDRCNAIRRGHVTGNGTLRNHAPANQEGLSPARPGLEYDEEEWDRAWANVAQSLNCIVAMTDRLLGREKRPEEVTSGQHEVAADTHRRSHNSESWQDHLLPLVVTLRDCVREASGMARAAMSFVLLQGALAATMARGTAQLTQRRDAVFSQALSAAVCGLMLRLCHSLDDPLVLKQFVTVGVVLQFEGLLSTYGEEVGMLEDMEVGVTDLSGVTFCVTAATTDQPEDMLPRLRGTRGSTVVEMRLPSEMFAALPRELQEGSLIRVHPVLFNIGINQQQSMAERFGDSSLQERINQNSCELLKSYCTTVRQTLPESDAVQSVAELLSSLQTSVDSRKRKNVEVLWLAASICRGMHGVRLTSCKSAKDRTAMSVTLEQCALLRDRHTLSHLHFNTALECMRREGCRMENVQKNICRRRFAFSSVQLLTFPKQYRPPEGTYGKFDS